VAGAVAASTGRTAELIPAAIPATSNLRRVKDISIPSCGFCQNGFTRQLLRAAHRKKFPRRFLPEASHMALVPPCASARDCFLPPDEISFHEPRIFSS
jgi:hypothetical protein